MKKARFVDYPTQLTRWQDTETYMDLRFGVALGAMPESSLWRYESGVPGNMFRLELERRAKLEA